MGNEGFFWHDSSKYHNNTVGGSPKLEGHAALEHVHVARLRGRRLELHDELRDGERLGVCQLSENSVVIAPVGGRLTSLSIQIKASTRGYATAGDTFAPSR